MVLVLDVGKLLRGWNRRRRRGAILPRLLPLLLWRVEARRVGESIWLHGSNIRPVASATGQGAKAVSVLVAVLRMWVLLGRLEHARGRGWPGLEYRGSPGLPGVVLHHGGHGRTRPRGGSVRDQLDGVQPMVMDGGTRRWMGVINERLIWPQRASVSANPTGWAGCGQ